MKMESLLRSDLARITERFARAGEMAWRATAAGATGEADEAEDQRREAAGEFWAAGQELADLLLLLLRYALNHRPDALRLYLAEALRPELEPLFAAIAEMEQRQ